MEPLIQGLSQLGLRRKEAQVYLALLQLNQASAQAVAQKAGLKRPTTYVILTDLMQQGLVLKSLKHRRQMFVAKPPRELLASAETRLSEARSIFPSLEALMQKQSSVRTLYFEGLSGVREALYYRFSELRGQPIKAFFGDSERAMPELNRLFHTWNADAYKNGNIIRSVVPRSKSLRLFRKNDRKYGFSSKEIPPHLYGSKCSIDITPLFVRIIFFKEMQALIIENPEMASALSEVFEMVYSGFSKAGIVANKA